MLRVSLLAFLASAAPALAQTVTVETATGPVEAPANPETIVVLDVAAMDTLDALGVTADGVTDMLYVDYLDDFAAEAEAVGTLFEPDFEAINAISPDLIIAGGRSQEVVPQLADISPTIDMTIWGDDLVAQALDRLATYGTLFGREAEAEAVASEFDAKLEAARAAAAEAGTALIVMTNGPRVSAYGAGSRFGWVHGALDLPEAVPDIDQDASHGEAVSFEFIRDANPDWLIVVDRAAAIGDEGEAAAQTLDNPLVAETTAWREGQVIYLNPAEIYIAGGGIQALGHALDAMLAGFSGGA
jgi:iron complex transport system substrate-binding protein